MKRVKSIIGIVLAVAMVAVMCAFSASAEMTLSIELDKSQLAPGEEVIAEVAVSNYQTVLSGFAVTINYDKDALELTNVVPEDYGAEVVIDPEDLADADGSIKLVWFTADFDGIVDVSKLADLTFVAKQETTNAAISAGFVSSGMIGAGENLAPIGPEDGVYSDAVVDAPSLEIGTEGGEGGEPEEPVGNGSANNESSTIAGYSETDVYATYNVGTRTDMYKVDVTWGSMQFTYTEADETWDPDDHAWELDDAAAVGTWTPAENGVSNKVSFKNHSSKAVTVTFGFVDSLEEDTITATWSAENLSLAGVSGVGAAAVVAEGNVTMGLSGKFTNETTTAVVIGEATATIA